MKTSANTHRLHNSLAYRFSKLSKSLQSGFLISLHGRTFQVPLISTLGESNIQLKENWFGTLLRALKLPENTDFLDIGANVGQTLLTFRSLYANPYWGFEPNPICNYYLEDLIRANGFRNVQIIPTGLAGRSALVPFYLKNSHDTGATIVTDFRQDYYEPGEVKYVPVFPLDDLGLQIGRISLIKIDVEGAELDVISGMKETIRKHQPVIICEVLDYHSEESRVQAQDRADQLMAHFLALQYRAHRIVHSGNTLQYEPVPAISLKLFSDSSYDMNDYLFLPEHMTNDWHVHSNIINR